MEYCIQPKKSYHKPTLVQIGNIKTLTGFPGSGGGGGWGGGSGGGGWGGGGGSPWRS